MKTAYIKENGMQVCGMLGKTKEKLAARGYRRVRIGSVDWWQKLMAPEAIEGECAWLISVGVKIATEAKAEEFRAAVR